MMPVARSPIENDRQRVQRLLQEERGRLAQLTKDGALGADNAEAIEACRLHLQGLQELADAVQTVTAAQARDAAGATAFQRDRYSVLVVDDNDAQRYSISRALRASGYQTFEASGGAEALELSKFASALVLDVQLPDVHGFEVCRLVRSETRTSDLPIIHVSAVHRSYADRQASRRMGADDFMTCPLEFPLLARRLDGLLLQRASRS